MNCPGCGATVPDGANWCSLCFMATADMKPEQDTVVDFQRSPTPRPDAPRPDDVQVTATAAGESGPGPGPVPVPTSARLAEELAEEWVVLGGIGDHQLVACGDKRAWRCGACGQVEPLDTSTCSVCGTLLFSAEQHRAKDVRAEPATATWWSALPGGGLWYIGLRMHGVAAASFVLLCFVAAASFPAQGVALAGRVLFFVGGIGLWVAAMRDARVAATTGDLRSMVFYGRRFFWVAGAMIGLLVVVGVAAVLAGVMS